MVFPSQLLMSFVDDHKRSVTGNNENNRRESSTVMDRIGSTSPKEQPVRPDGISFSKAI